MVLKALTQEFLMSCPWKWLYADNFVIAETLEELITKLATWKARFAGKSLKVNIDKTKIMVRGTDLNTLKKFGSTLVMFVSLAF